MISRSVKRRHHIPLLRRRRKGKTDYSKRKAVVLGRSPFITGRVANKNIIVQISTASPEGDRVIASSHSRELLKYGWKGSRKNTPAAYLAGLVAGLRASSKGVKKAVLYTGVAPYVHHTRISGLVKGVIDGGVEVPSDPKTFPDSKRVSGRHIAEYASALSEEKTLAKARFSHIVQEGLSPQDYPTHFEEVRKRILESVKHE